MKLHFGNMINWFDLFRFKHFLTDQVMKEPPQACGNREKIIVLPSYNMHGGTISSNFLLKIFPRKYKDFSCQRSSREERKSWKWKTSSCWHKSQGWYKEQEINWGSTKSKPRKLVIGKWIIYIVPWTYWRTLLSL